MKIGLKKMNKYYKHKRLINKSRRSMLFSGRAYYNLLWLSKLRGHHFFSENWEATDYRTLPTDSLFAELESVDIFFDSDSFILFSKNVDSPEELSELLQQEEGKVKRKTYLVVFELWRRLMPDRRSISIFCDELDRQIAIYKAGSEQDTLFTIFNEILEILDRNSASEQSPKQVFASLCLYIAHDLENVIYTYIKTNIEREDKEPYVGLIDYFLPYVREKRALQFLKLKTLSNAFDREKQRLIGYLLSSLQESINVSISIPLLLLLVEENQKELFLDHFSFLVENIMEEDKLGELLDTLLIYHQRIGQKSKQELIKQLQKSFFTTNSSGKETGEAKQKILALLYV